MTIKNLLQQPDIDLREIRRLQNTLSPIRRENLRLKSELIGVLTTVNGKFTIDGNWYWVRFPAGLGSDGIGLYSAPVPIRGPSNGFDLREWEGFPVVVGVGGGSDNQLEIRGVDAPTFIESGGQMRTLIVTRPENKFVYFHDIVPFSSRPLGTLANPSTIVQVRKLWYDDEYGDINRWGGTDLAVDKVDLASSIPAADKQRLAVLFYDSFEDSIQVTVSTPRDLDDPIQKPADYQECFDQRPAESMPVQAYLLQNNQAAVNMTNLDVDLRQFVNVPRTWGFPNPITKKLLIRSGRTVVVHGFNSTSEITNFGEVYDLEGTNRVTAPGGTFGDHIAGNYSAFGNNGILRMEGAARVTKEIQIKAEGLKLGATAPTQAVIGNFSVLQFAGVGTIDTVYTSFHVPDDWAVGTDINIHLHWAPVNGNAGDVKWQMSWKAVASEANEVISGVGTSTFVIDAAQGLQDELLETDHMTIGGANLVAEDTVGFCLLRDPTDGDDTYASAASLVHIEIAYTADRLGTPT